MPAGNRKGEGVAKRPARAAGATLTVRQIPQETYEAFRVKAAAHGRSMEEEARQLIIAQAGVRPTGDLGPLRAMRERIRARHGGRIPPEIFEEYLKERREAARKEWAEINPPPKAKKKR